MKVFPGSTENVYLTVDRQRKWEDIASKGGKNWVKISNEELDIKYLLLATYSPGKAGSEYCLSICRMMDLQHFNDQGAKWKALEVEIIWG